MRLAHFTRIFSLAGIVREGISKGEVAISPVYVINFPWFACEFSQEAQVDWAGYTSDKTALRLEVEFGEQDGRRPSQKEINLNLPHNAHHTQPSLGA